MYGWDLGFVASFVHSFPAWKAGFLLEKLKFHFKRRERERGREVESSWLHDANHLVSQGQDWVPVEAPRAFLEGVLGNHSSVQLCSQGLREKFPWTGADHCLLLRGTLGTSPSPLPSHALPCFLCQSINTTVLTPKSLEKWILLI